ncbi:hypothetical protein HB364_23375 [Pseudoflavitalea sp. X16]|uniref:hypothetical protein n=1 Tax=Paraflavitalea devenefica TaxID=2716334 RepID=UPI00141EF353|nr:hypothetical protein [Paraflavitalea devenefica]NII28045.1 hypothetical protein [Paraflavitalea devenefica]
MQQHIHTIVKYFFQKDTLREVPEQVLQQFTEEHPYSAVGHWLLAKKIHDTEPERATAQSAGAVPWFHNPLWLHWTLQDHEPVAETVSIPAAANTAPPVTVWERPQVSQEPAPAPAQEPEAITITATPEAVAVEPVTTTPAIDDTDFTETEILIPGVSEPVSLIEEPPAPPPPAVETALPAAAEASPVPEAALPGSFKPVISESEEPVFEPYHTIDYFASQGIKLRQEDLKDKLGMQLKSFTEWLRSMKRVAPVIVETPVANTFDETQQSIQEIAGHSVEGKEVVTEAMAEVWVKQGSKEKAIAIYEKLSLLNPAKRPYFATRIDQIKAL